jgi:hypothetical protein
MPERRERRRVNHAVAADRRGRGTDRRRCPACPGGNSRLVTHAKAVKGGTLTTSFCYRCGFTVRSKQVNAEHAADVLSATIPTATHPDGVLLVLPAHVAKLMGLGPRAKVSLDPVLRPGSRPAAAWELRRAD